MDDPAADQDAGRVRMSGQAPPWRFSVRAPVADLAGRGLLGAV